jgi:predicted esterase
MGYTGHEDVSGYEAPTYVIVGDDDWIAPPRLMKKRVDTLKMQGTALVFKIVLGVAHGFGLGNHTKAEGWIHEAITFWKKHTQK